MVDRGRRSMRQQQLEDYAIGPDHTCCYTPGVNFCMSDTYLRIMSSCKIELLGV
jgi:hypothetical protein